ncbi:Myc-type [Hirschfeldia incana]|nr:Myc-type [Hirschfeldia incana]
MALEGAISQHSYNGKEVYSNIYTDYESPFSDLQAALCFLDNQTDNNDSTFLQEGYYGNTTTFLHQPPNEIVVNEEKPKATCDISFHGDMGKNQVTRRRTRAKKNKEEISNQRMTHIAVERNRRRQMNEYLSALRSLMPESYVQRCDQASTVGGAINFIRELEHRLHLQNEPNEISLSGSCMSSATPFSDTFKLPQFSMGSSSVSDNMVLEVNALADIEVSLVESHATLKIRSRRRPKVLLNLVSGLQSLGFIILHLNVSTVSDFVLYCFSTKMEDYCKLSTVADIASAVYELLKMHHDS